MTILERYSEKFRRSGQLYERSKGLIPGGGHQSRRVDPFPIFVEHAEGALKWDVDGNEIVDYMMGYGALIVGHANPVINRAVADRLSQGLTDALSLQEVAGHVHGVASIVHVVLGAEGDCDGEICDLPHAEIARPHGAPVRPAEAGHAQRGRGHDGRHRVHGLRGPSG